MRVRYLKNMLVYLSITKSFSEKNPLFRRKKKGSGGGGVKKYHISINTTRPPCPIFYRSWTEITSPFFFQGTWEWPQDISHLVRARRLEGVSVHGREQVRSRHPLKVRHREGFREDVGPLTRRVVAHHFLVIDIGKHALWAVGIKHRQSPATHARLDTHDSLLL